MKSGMAVPIDRILLLLLLVWAAMLHGTVFVSAGALWRDEANSIQQARLPSWGDLLQSLEYDSFPVLYPSLVRLWSSIPWAASDEGLRTLGFVTGIALLASLLLVAKLMGTRWPGITLVLLAGNALLIAEGDSIRPYGVSLILLVWAYGLMGRAVVRPSPGTLAIATLLSVLSVQATYTNALSIGVFCLCAAGVSAVRGERRGLWRFFVPGCAAALSLIPYADVLRRAGDWAAVLNQRVDWLQLFHRLAESHSLPAAIAWLGFAGLAAVVSRRIQRSPFFAYQVWVLLLSFVVQIVFVEAAGLVPFPRYFLPLAIFAALVIEAALEGWKSALRFAAVAAALFLTAWPAWSWLRQRHTNVDRVAVLLAQRATPRDLVVVTPWFLHTSFQRYYRGECRWITVPDLDRQPMMRYDLIGKAMMDTRAETGVAHALQSALDRGGTIWLVSQRPWTSFARAEAPEIPTPARAPRGADYVRFRSYWERDIEHRLHACCAPPQIVDVAGGRVWGEEDLIISGWKEKKY